MSRLTVDTGSRHAVPAVVNSKEEGLAEKWGQKDSKKLIFLARYFFDLSEMTLTIREIAQ
jgi:hypothetical protein